MQKKKNIASPSTTQHHDTPNNKTHFIKFRVTEIEKMELEHTAKLLNLSLSTLIRRALHNVKIEKKIIVANSGEETLTAVSTLLAQCSKVGTNLNQLARHFNSGGADTEQIRAKILDELADLTVYSDGTAIVNSQFVKVKAPKGGAEEVYQKLAEIVK